MPVKRVGLYEIVPLWIVMFGGGNTNLLIGRPPVFALAEGLVTAAVLNNSADDGGAEGGGVAIDAVAVCGIAVVDFQRCLILGELLLGRSVLWYSNALCRGNSCCG